MRFADGSYKAAAVVLAGALALGLATAPLRAPGNPVPPAPGGGAGVSLAMLGGWRTLAADGCWLRAMAAWERRDAPALQATLRLTVLADPRPVTFWIQGARFLGYDVPAWRLAELAARGPVPAAVRQRIEEEQAQQALRWLDEARIHHPDHSAVAIEQAGLHLHRRHDWAAAAECYRRAAELPGAPWFAARLHGELLRRLGRHAEAYAWLVRLHPRLPAGDEAAAADLVLARIRELEVRLGVPPNRAYRAP